MLSADEARLLDRLILGATSASPFASASGLRRTSERGAGLEFQDYRHYQPGDDPRLIDWTVEARLRQLVVRVSRAEGHLRMHLLMDVSRSMSVGSPEKLECACKLAAALCYVAIERRDGVALVTFDDTIRDHVPMDAGRAQLVRIFDTLAGACSKGQSSINRALTKYAGAVRGPGLAVVFSDFFQSSNVLEGLRHLLYRGLTPVVIQVLAAEEIEPDVTGEVEMVDIEDPSARPIVVDETMVAAYRERLAMLSGDLKGFCARHRLPYVRVDSSASFEQMLQACEQASLICAYA
jgi:uncharacterized protein (DUF58 family)